MSCNAAGCDAPKLPADRYCAGHTEDTSVTRITELEAKVEALREAQETQARDYKKANDKLWKKNEALREGQQEMGKQMFRDGEEMEALRVKVAARDDEVRGIGEFLEHKEAQYKDVLAKNTALRVKVADVEEHNQHLEDVVSAYCDDHGGVSEITLQLIKAERAAREASDD